MNSNQWCDGMMACCRQAIDHGSAWLGYYMTEDGQIPLYVTTTRPENMTEIADRLRLPSPPRF